MVDPVSLSTPALSGMERPRSIPVRNNSSPIRRGQGLQQAQSFKMFLRAVFHRVASGGSWGCDWACCSASVDLGPS